VYVHCVIALEEASDGDVGDFKKLSTNCMGGVM